MGGYIGLGLARYAPDRIEMLIIGGEHAFAAEPSGQRRWLRYGVEEGHAALITVKPLKQRTGRSVRLIRLVWAADLQAWPAMAVDRNGIEDILGKMQMPCCVYAGDADREFSNAKATSNGIPNASFVRLPELTHMQAFYASEVVVPKIEKFLAS